MRAVLRAAALMLAATAALTLHDRAAMAGLVNSDPDFEAAMSCAKASKPCEVAACFNNYLAHTAPADVSDDVKQTLSTAAAACQKPPQQQDTKVDEERLLGSARQCMVAADPCIVKTCYAEYLQKYGAAGALRGIAQSDLSRAQKACPPTTEKFVADGTYNARSKEACGAKPQFGIFIAIKNGAISWEHDFRGTRYSWSGTVEPTGGIRASVGGSNAFTADGQYTDASHEILMHYPQCDSTISLSILSRVN